VPHRPERRPRTATGQDYLGGFPPDLALRRSLLAPVHFLGKILDRLIVCRAISGNLLATQAADASARFAAPGVYRPRLAFPHADTRM
jgi:hypothetical protein